MRALPRSQRRRSRHRQGWQGGVGRVVVDAAAANGFRFGEVEEPKPDPGQVVVEVRHVSLNRGDLNDARSGRVPAGAVLGSDVAGVVLQADSGGEGPPAGAQVVGLTAGAFAPRCLVDVRNLAEVPAEVELAATAALPVAGLAALRTLRAGDAGPGRRVLVTGASGGVGRFAVQLAAHAGAHVVASVGSATRGAGLHEIGAAEVVVGFEGLEALAEPVDVVVENVGGPGLVAAWNRLAPGGSLQSVGWTSGEPAVFPPYATVGPPKSLTSFLIEGEVGADLAELVARLAEGALTVPVGWRGPWDKIDAAAAALRDRRVDGKAILDVS